MLDKISVYQVPAPKVQSVTGRYIAHGKMTKPERAVLAAEIHDGAVRLERLTVAQLARLLNVSPAYVHRAVAATPPERWRIRAGFQSLANTRPVLHALPMPTLASASEAELWAQLEKIT
jgi:hypothetical protein